MSTADEALLALNQEAIDPFVAAANGLRRRLIKEGYPPDAASQVAAEYLSGLVRTAFAGDAAAAAIHQED